MPRSSRISFFLSGDNNANHHDLFEQFNERLKSDTIDETFSEDIFHICKKFLTKLLWDVRIEYSHSKIGGDLLNAIAYLDNEEVLELALPLAFSSSDFYLIVGRRITARGREWLLSKCVTLNYSLT